ncbi:MAG: Cyclic nucleotide-binding protein [Pedosphaera sp.]|nr:Cyclic nucleotide-binding protein [Pedosphaera sp.]
MKIPLVDELRRLPLFANLSGEQTRCIEEGRELKLALGETLLREGDTAEDFSVLLEGELRITRKYGNQEIVMATHKPGMFLGEISLLLDVPSLATARAVKASRSVVFGKASFWKILSTCPSVAEEILRTMATRVRNMETFSQQREKLMSLGTMAAGLAHELNNPAAAAARAAVHLQTTTTDVQAFACQLNQRLTPAQWGILVDGSGEALARAAKAERLDSMAQSDQEEAVSSWLEQQGVAEGWKLATAFVSSGLDEKWLAALAAALPGEALDDSLGWLEARISLKNLLNEIEQSTKRISELVKAVKSYSYMDQTPLQQVDVHEGLESTLTMLGHKLKGVEVVRDYDRTLPRLMAYGSELNQVWTNLLDNAADAVKPDGKICVRTFQDDGQVVVAIRDTGKGIPPEAQAHMFEPFFTTKGVGSGTGLGLMISNRIVAERHEGEIEFESKPGLTEFRVRLPIKREVTA